MVAGGVRDLPAALAPWSRELSLFPRDLALDLGAIVRRLASMVGTAVPARATSGDPDGFDGLARRGPYDRLLHSEWLLADEMPEEFARRAAMQEHLFVELGRQQRVQHPLAVALFDCGPSQIGTPRLVHIAALVVLSRRAAAVEATFRWGMLQNPEQPLFEDVSPGNVDSLLRARTTIEGTESHLEAWDQTLAGEEPVGELWIIGPQRLERFPAVRRNWHLEVEDVLEPGARQVSAAVRHDTRHDPPALLALPPDDQCVRLLRDPFLAAVPHPVKTLRRLQFASNVVFGRAGRAILGRSPEGHLVVQPYANSPKATTPKRRTIDSGAGVVIAAGWQRGPGATYVTVSEQGVHTGHHVRDPGLRFYERPSRGHFPIAGQPDSPGELQPLYTTPVAHFAGGTLFVDAGCNLWNAPRVGPLEHITDNVAAIRVEATVLTVIRRTDNDQWEVIRPASRGFDRIQRFPDAGKQAYFGYAGRSKKDGFIERVMAFEQAGGTWLVVSAKGNEVIHPVPESTVAGVGRTNLTRETALVCLEKDRRCVTLKGPEGALTLSRTTSPIAHLSVAADHPHIAWVLESGEVEIASLVSGQKMFRSLPGNEETT